MATAQEHGEIKLEFVSADGGRSQVALIGRTERLGHVAPASATDRRQMYPVSFRHGGVVADENSTVAVMFKSDAADIIESEECKMIVDCTLINKQTGAMTPTSLTFENTSGAKFTAAGTVDLTVAAAAWILVDSHKVPAGVQLVMGHPAGTGKAYLFIGDDT